MSVSTVIKEQLKAQRDKLLDLSGRNNLISFKFPIKEKARSQNYLSIVDDCRWDAFEEYKKAIINSNHIPPAKKKIGASLNNSIEKILLAIGIKPIETKVIPERYASWDLFI